ncbi:trimethylamine---corrinoid protein Co-methyltransferase [[Luteovulum] sphaeroides subsp. megalophilum]|uniref:trimethylamine methyltransferase family protein n=1 Tax=Cereibacter sphaeroides TaxID=1063 RepID=UPI000B72E5D2|nr:trimethylamine methyltransferase family protein [Cereibacter sphaeroides]SNT27967.1 trimethylamine---corrinoid protein Co-methyltransferase [[Luteovulum] sphaeroides subsp. megalophilum]
MGDLAVRQARAGGRGARRALRAAPDLAMLPSLKRGLPECAPMSPEEVERIDAASMAILEEVGVVFRDPVALADWKRVGADVRGERVHLDRGLVRALIATIPSGWTYRARNPERSLPFGGRHSIFVPMTGAPFLRDLEDVRRWPTLADLNMFHKLAHMSPALHSTAHHIVEPMDRKVSHRHLHITYSSMKYSDKTFMGMTTSGRNAEDVLQMCEILFGRDAMEETPVTTGNCNGNSPLVWDETMLSAMRAFCRRNQPVLCSPFVLGGANTPASVAPAVAQLNAEALSALAYTQVIRKGCPAIYGHYLSTVSMKSGAPMAGTPEISLMNFMIGQMARFYNVPWRTSNLLGGAKTFDAQAGYESAMTMNAVLHAGAHYIWHSAGWNEAGMHCSVAKFVVDAEMCAMGYRMAEGIRWDDFEAGLAAVRDVGPGGHYLGHPHTLENFERAFFMPKLFDNNSIEQWQAEGAVEITGRALAHARKLLADYEEPKLDPGIDEALRDYIARREAEIPAEDALNTDH